MDWTQFLDPSYLGRAAGIAGADLLLSGDNALVIAAVCARLDPGRRRIGMALGVLGAVLLRVGFAWAGGMATLWPGVGVAGALLLLYVASNLVTESGGEGETHEASESLLGAVFKIVVADVSMSLDNVIAVSALARGDVGLLAIGIGFSILCVILLSGVISALIARFPIVKWVGGAFLGWVAGGVASGDRALLDLLKADEHALHLVLGGIGLAFVLVQGLSARRARRAGRADVNVGRVGRGGSVTSNLI